MIAAIENLPEVSFIDGMSLDNMKANLTTWYKDRYRELTGKEIMIKQGERTGLMINACAVQLYQLALYVNRGGQLNLLKYAYDEYLDNMAALKGVTRKPATAATVTMRFSIEEALGSAVGIPAGTRVKVDELYFASDSYQEITAGNLYVDVPCTCQTVGEDGNGYGVGEITTLTDSVPYISSVSNVTESSGGADIEDDEDLAERVYYAPGSYSTAGSIESYEYHVRAYSPDVGSIVIKTPSACNVDIYVLMEDGSLPTNEFKSGCQAYLSSEDKRPLTDNVTVKSPTTTSFNIDLTYYIAQSDSSQATIIQSEVAQAINDYVAWQTGTIGLDINPSELVRRVMDAGAKRVVITYPVHTAVGDTAVARLGTKTVNYGGLESD